MTVEGIDISHWQTKTPPLGTSLGFVFARATYGLYPDQRYDMHARNVLAAGKVLGAYHFGRYGDGAAQARAFLNVIGPHVKLVALDWEKDGDNPHMTPAQGQAFIRTVQASGRKVGVYASEANFPDSLGQDWKWVAKWGTDEPRGLWAFWQYGVANHIDRDRFSGTLDQLRILAGLPVTWRWSLRPTPPASTARFTRFTVENGHITGTGPALTRGTNVACSAPVFVPAAPGKPDEWSRELVRFIAPGKKRDGWWVDARYAKEIE